MVEPRFTGMILLPRAFYRVVLLLLKTPLSIIYRLEAANNALFVPATIVLAFLTDKVFLRIYRTISSTGATPDLEPPY